MADKTIDRGLTPEKHDHHKHECGIRFSEGKVRTSLIGFVVLLRRLKRYERVVLILKLYVYSDRIFINLFNPLKKTISEIVFCH